MQWSLRIGENENCKKHIFKENYITPKINKNTNLVVKRLHRAFIFIFMKNLIKMKFAL